MPFSHQGRVRRHPQLEDRLEVTHATIANRLDGSRATYRHTKALPDTASNEEIAAAFGAVARLSLLAAMENEQ